MIPPASEQARPHAALGVEKAVVSIPCCYLAACRANRRAAELLRTMDWGNREAIKEIYEIARTVTELTGERHEVDHVIPLQCENVSGLHVENNLLVLPLSENRSKGATFTPGQRRPAGGIKKARALLQKVQQEQTLEPA